MNELEHRIKELEHQVERLTERCDELKEQNRETLAGIAGMRWPPISIAAL